MSRLMPWARAIAVGAESLQGDRARKQADQERLEDRLLRKEMHDLQRRKLEDALNAPPEPEPLVVTLDDQGNPVHTPRSQAAGRRAPRAPEPLEVVIGQGGRPTYTPRSQAAGAEAPRSPEPLVQVATPGGGAKYVPRGQAVGAEAPRPPAPGTADVQKETNAAKEALALLDDIARDVETHGTDIDPRSTRRAGLASKFAQFQLKLKDAAKLGQLTESDMAIMLNVLNDPTSPKARAKALGSEATHRASVLAGAQAARETLETKLQNLGAGESDDFSDAELSAAWNAGKRTDADIAAWIRANRGPRIPK